MRKVKNIKIDQLVQVPTYCFAPNRSGWNGWLFTKGIVKAFGTSKTGNPLVKVEFPDRGYARAYRKRAGGFGIDERTTIEKWFITSAVFETDLDHQNWITQFPRDHFETPSYDHETEFLIDKGLVVDRFPESKLTSN
jgi:hypothetical protein